jgi:hypothetical protein
VCGQPATVSETYDRNGEVYKVTQIKLKKKKAMSGGPRPASMHDVGGEN